MHARLAAECFRTPSPHPPSPRHPMLNPKLSDLCKRYEHQLFSQFFLFSMNTPVSRPRVAVDGSDRVVAIQGRLITDFVSLDWQYADIAVFQY